MFAGRDPGQSPGWMLESGRSHGDARGEEPPVERAEAAEPAFAKLLERVPADVRDVSFSTAVRGYDRREVDSYVKRVNRVIAELEITASPQSAVKHALDRVGEQTAGVLQRAREAADELTTAALAESEHATRRAKVEAAELVEKAQHDSDALRVSSAEEADKVIERACAEAAKRLEAAEERRAHLEAEAQSQLDVLNAQIATAKEARSRAIDEVRATAAELERLASATRKQSPPARPREAPAGARGTESADAPTQALPKPGT
jgi:DivIVA domain-containing protein